FILHEMPLAEDGYGEAIAAGFSETLRVWTEGTQYKLSELKQVLAAAGFEQLHSADSLGPYVFVIGVKPRR
ncbi:MAG: methyltransferase, partial [Gammaproteobacteria bacterium]|nr:methyltransferase [Gammaproteobacteria bacterium]